MFIVNFNFSYLYADKRTSIKIIECKKLGNHLFILKILIVILKTLTV